MSQPDLKPLKISDRPFIDDILKTRETMLSAYSFVSHYIWKDIFRYNWGIIDQHLCLFAQYDHYRHMPVPPVPCTDSVTDTFSWDKIEAEIISIENIDDSQRESFIAAGFKLRPGEGEYVYLRDDLITLKGDLYKSKRAMCNHFVKHYRYQYEFFSPCFADGCHRLYDYWTRQKKEKTDNSFSHALMEDASSAHSRAIRHHRSLQLEGRVVLINKRVEGYIFGFARKDTFYILMEVANPEVRGLAQFIFREFCREMDGYTYINTLGDSGLENLRRVKLSYRPFRVIPSYSAYLL